MAISVIRGLVVQETKFGEADKMLTVLAKDIGKVSISAKGARKLSTPVSAGTALFTYGDFTIKTGSKYHFLNQTDIIESFYNISKDIFSFAYGSAILELATKTTDENIPANDILLLTISTLKMLSDGYISPQLALIIYELKLIQYGGFMPQMDSCIVCGSSHSNMISPSGVMCSSCAKREHRVIKANETAIFTLNYVFANEGRKLFSFNVADEYIPILEKIANMLVYSNYSISLNSKKFIDSLNMT